MNRFIRYELRTIDLDAARAFYTEVVGPALWGPDVSIVPLPERARARGAPPHWLGYVGVSDVEGTIARVVAAGGQRLGPTPVVQDPFGAIFGLSAEDPPEEHAPVAWHLLTVTDSEGAMDFYASLFGWTRAGARDLAGQPFAWSGQRVGSIADTARLPHVHPQWLRFFRVPDLAASLAVVRARGGKVITPMRTPAGNIVAPCDDPQGGAFALYQ